MAETDMAETDMAEADMAVADMAVADMAVADMAVADVSEDLIGNLIAAEDSAPQVAHGQADDVADDLPAELDDVQGTDARTQGDIDAEIEDDEADLALADAEAADLAAAQNHAPMPDRDATAAATPAHSHLRAEPDADEAALSRIMSQTDARLNRDEASRRRAAIAQLRAAVAATEAARRMGEVPAVDDDEVENAFRDDLKQAVRPRRAMHTGDARSDRPRPAPLKLVASQRVDLPRPAAKAAMPIRPRRVTLANDPAPAAEPQVFLAAVNVATQSSAAPSSTARSFADFAEDMGAVSLADLLEAAAAYTSFVEGVEDFSRPQLMKKIDAVAPEPFTREDTLRSFGTLLRQGRITRGRPGRFQVAQGTRFNPERHVG